MPDKRIWGSLDSFYEPGPVLGRRVANTRFLRQLLAADPFDEYHFFIGDEALRKSLDEHLRHRHGELARAGRLKILHRMDLPAAVAERDYHVFHLSDCVSCPAHLARVRNAVSRRIFPITGTTHSLSYANFAPAFLAHLWPGTSARDAVVCTSTAGREVMREYYAGLRRGYGLDETAFPAPRLELIPLGVDEEYARVAPERGQGPCRLLVFGRISHFSKMDLLPLLRALGRVLRMGVDRESVELVLAGWVDDGDEYAETVRNLAANAGVRLRLEPRPSEQRKRELFAQADVFVSIPDNPQETFGLTVLEAGAFGLPCVVADYDGYRDLVVHESTGLLVPTTGPGPGGWDRAELMAPLLFDNHYHLHLAQAAGVDVPALADALHRLMADPGLRRTMGDAARKHVLEHFSWPSVIDRHLALWEELNRAEVDRESLRRARHPLHAPYARLFGPYHTRMLGPDDQLVATATGTAVYRQQDFPVLPGGLADAVLPEPLARLGFLARKPLAAEELARKLMELEPGLDDAGAWRHISFALKHDLLRLALPGHGE